MKRIILFALVCALLLPLAACKKGGESEPSEPTYTDIEFTDELKEMITSFDTDPCEFAYVYYRTVIDDGDTENSSGSALSFEGRKKDGRYYGKYSGISSAISFQIDYEFYYADGVTYQIYTDPSVEELNEYYKFESTEKEFTDSFDGLAPVIAGSFAGAAARVSSDGVTTVTVTVEDEDTLRAFDGDVVFVAQSNGISREDITVTAPVITYAIKDARLAGALLSFDMSMEVDGVQRVYQFDREFEVIARGDDVKDVTLPDNLEKFQDLESEE